MSRHRTAALLVLTSSAVVYSGVVSSLVRQWASDDNYSHGFLIIPLALYGAWERRSQLRCAAPTPSIAGLLVLSVSLLVFAIGVLAAELFLARISLVGVVIGTVLFVWGREHLRLLAFPIALLPLMVPLPTLVFNQIAFPLQLLASRVGEATIAAAGIPVLREGNILELPNTTLAVAEACSGIRSLISLITLAVVLAYFTERRAMTRAVIVLSAIPIAVLANAARVAGTGLASHWFGRAAAEGFFHGFSGWLMFAVAFAGLLIVQRALRYISMPRVSGWGHTAAEEKCSPAR
ncbi:MAG TPA: exosortase A [Vicinamibacterales bacterium]|nr:exosortase A [Vicinamibacterales bacterium]